MAADCSRDAVVRRPPSSSLASEDVPVIVFLDSNLDTHLALPVSPLETVAELKKKIEIEHRLCFPTVGQISVDALKIKTEGHFYHLSNSMLVRSPFHGKASSWVLHMDISAQSQEELEQTVPASQIGAQPPEILNVGNKRIDQSSVILTIPTDNSTDMCNKPLPHSFGDMLSSDGKRKKDISISKVEKEPSKGFDDGQHCSNATKSRKRKNVKKSVGADHHDLGSIDGRCSGKNSGMCDDLGNRNTSHDDSKVPSLRETSLQPIEAPGHLKSTAEKKRKHEGSGNAKVESHLDNHQTKSLVDFLASGATNIIDSHDAVTNKSSKLTQRKKTVTGTRNTKSDNETLAREVYTSGHEIEALENTAILGTEVGIVSRKKKPKTTEPAVLQELTVPVSDATIAKNIPPAVCRHTEVTNHTDLSNDEGSFKKKNKKSRGKMKDLNLEISRSSDQQLTSSMGNENHVHSEEVPSNVHPGFQTYDWPNAIKNQGCLASDTIEPAQKLKVALSEETTDIRNQRASQTSPSRTPTLIDAHEMTPMEVNDTDACGTQGSRKSDIVGSEVVIISKEKKKKKSRGAETSVGKEFNVSNKADNVIAPNISLTSHEHIESHQVDNDIAPNISLTSHEHVEPLNGVISSDDKNDKLKKMKKTRGKGKGEILEASRLNHQLSSSLGNEKCGQTIEELSKMLAGSNSSPVPNNGCTNPIDNHGDVISNIIESIQREKTNLSEKTMDMGNTKSGSRPVLIINEADRDVHKKEALAKKDVDVHERDVLGKKDIVGDDDGSVFKEGKIKKAKRVKHGASKTRSFSLGEANNVVSPNVSVSSREHAEIVKKNISIDEDSMKKKEKISGEKVRDVDSKSRLKSQLPSLIVNQKRGHTEEETSKMHLRSNDALRSAQSQKMVVDSNMQSDHEPSLKDKKQHDGFPHLKSDSLNDYFKAGLSNGEDNGPDQNLASIKRTKFVSAQKPVKENTKHFHPSNESDTLVKAHDNGHLGQSTDDLTNKDTSNLHDPALAGEYERSENVFCDVKARGASHLTAATNGATNYEIRSKGRNASVESDAATTASLASLSTSIYSDGSLSSADSETQSPNPSLNGYLLASRENMRSIGRKMMLTKGSMADGKLSDVWKSSSSCRKAKLQASSSQPDQTNADDDNPHADVVMDTQTDI